MTTVETGRLRLRPWVAGDLDALTVLFAEPRFWQFPFGRGLSAEETARFLERQIEHRREHGFGVWAAERRDGGDLIGYIGLAIPTWLPEVLPAVEVGWRLRPDQWGRGLATEGGRASLEHGFDQLGLDRIISIYMPANVASGRVMDKLGMTHFLTTTDTTGVTIDVREITQATWRR